MPDIALRAGKHRGQQSGRRTQGSASISNAEDKGSQAQKEEAREQPEAGT